MIWVWATFMYTRLARTNSNDPAVSSISDEGLAVGEQLVRDYPASVESPARSGQRTWRSTKTMRLNLNPTIAEAEHAAAGLATGWCRCAGRASWPIFLANRPEAFQPQCPPDSEAYMVFPSVLFYQIRPWVPHTGTSRRRIASCTIGTTGRSLTINPQQFGRTWWNIIHRW